MNDQNDTNELSTQEEQLVESLEAALIDGNEESNELANENDEINLESDDDSGELPLNNDEGTDAETGAEIDPCADDVGGCGSAPAPSAETDVGEDSPSGCGTGTCAG